MDYYRPPEFLLGNLPERDGEGQLCLQIDVFSRIRGDPKRLTAFSFPQNFVESNIPKSKKAGKFSLGVLDPMLATALQENLSISCRCDETVREIIRGIRFHFTKYVKPLEGGLLEQAQLGLGHAYSRSKVSGR